MGDILTGDWSDESYSSDDSSLSSNNLGLDDTDNEGSEISHATRTKIKTLQRVIDDLESDLNRIEYKLNDDVLGDLKTQVYKNRQVLNQIKGIVDFPTPPRVAEAIEVNEHVKLRLKNPDPYGNPVDRYEIWSSTNGMNYDFVESLDGYNESVEEITIRDRSFDKNSKVRYKIHAVRNGVKSKDPTTTSVMVTNQVPDPSRVNVQKKMDSFVITYPIPDNRKLKGFKIYCDAKEKIENLNQSDSVVVYEGDSNHVVYPIKEDEFDFYHKFWVESITNN